jgi:hypothetical protein
MIKPFFQIVALPVSTKSVLVFREQLNHDDHFPMFQLPSVSPTIRCLQL